MNQFVAQLGLSKRISGALIMSGYTTVQSLTYMTEAEFLRIKGLGRKALTERLTVCLTNHRRTV